MDPTPGTFHNTEGKIAVQAAALNNSGVININSADAAPSQEAKKIKILSALYKSTEKNRKDRNPDRVPGTCEWFTNHQTFQDWKASPTSKMLWVSADPGSGKSVLAKYLVDSILPTTESRTTCYFFFKDDFEGQGSAITALCCILFQLFERNRLLLSEDIIERFEIAGEGFSSSFNELWNGFLAAAKKHNAGEIVCVLDALDECKKDERCLLIEKLQQLYRGGTEFNLKFLVTSRPILEIRHGFHQQEIPESSLIHLSGESEAEMNKISQEIGIFIEARVKGIGKKFGLTSKERHILLEKLTSVPNRTYLWVYLTLNLIESDSSTMFNVSEYRILKITSRLPTTINEAYERILSTSSDVEQARLLLKILVAAARPLRLREMSLAMQLALQHDHHSYKGLQISSEQSEQLEKRISDYIRDLCGLFVVVIESGVYFIHQTAKEFLVENQEVDEDEEKATQATGESVQWRNSLRVFDCHKVLFDACVRHLFFVEFEADPLTAEQSVSKYAEKYTFLDYSANHWVAHLKSAQIGLNEREVKRILGLCEAASNRCRTWFRVYWASTNEDFPEGVTTLIIASYFGLQIVVKLLFVSRLGNAVNINATDGRYDRSALSWAAERGFNGVVKELLKVPRWKGIPSMLKRKAEVNAVDVYGRTPLIYAVWNRHMPVIKQLLKAGARIDVEDDIGGTPLSYAICSGRDDVVKQLLKTSDGIDSKDSISAKLLLSAVAKGRDDVVELLLEMGDISPDLRDDGGATLLMNSARRGYDKVIRLLIKHDADMEATDSNGRTAMIRAASNGAGEVVRLLVENGANIEATDFNGRTAMIYAASNGAEEIVRLLLENGANIEATDFNGRIAMIYAASNGAEKVVRLLVENGANIEATDSNGRTAMIRAASNGAEGIVRLLVENGANIEATDSNGRTAMIRAASNGAGEVVRLLVENGANIEATSFDGWTAMIHAASNGAEEIVRLLLENGANIEATDSNGRTAMIYAASNGAEEVVRLLLENGANIEATGSDGWTAMIYAASNGAEEVVRLLLENGANIEATDFNGRTAMIRAASNGAGEVVRLLVENGANIEATSFDGWTAMIHAASNGAEEVVRLLLENGANIEATDFNGRTAMIYAASNGAEEVVRLLLENGANVDATDNYGFTPLFRAVDSNHYNWISCESIVGRLIDAGANIKTRVIQGEPYSLLYKAIAKGEPWLIRLLLDNGADIEEKRESGPTPLFFALRKSNYEVVRMLLLRGAAREVKGAKGQTLRAFVNVNHGVLIPDSKSSTLSKIQVQHVLGGRWITMSIKDITGPDYLPSE
ncbi:uncharacterized protein DFL_003736 [Arthrobotrys flagrans]|uniref:Uncharacterized protein n=1 Tax=Arthrobotrys flagrans TaxID=97331 RepID=A0A437A2P7_ARTFL|nr:hypothetical protein DFL_003736 [Arthrobotrys flagrans]